MILRLLNLLMRSQGKDHLAGFLANNKTFQKIVVRVNQRISGGKWNEVEVDDDPYLDERVLQQHMRKGGQEPKSASAPPHTSTSESYSSGSLFDELKATLKETWEEETSSFRKRR